MNRVVEILMQRDGNTEQEAEKRIQETRTMMYEAIEVGNFDEAEQVIVDELGLELDYIEDILY